MGHERGTSGPGEIADLTLIFFAGVFATVGIAALFAYLGERARVRLAAKLLEQHQPLPPASLITARAPSSSAG